MRTLIIDDDPSSHKNLKHLLHAHHPDVQVIASGYDVEEGVALVNQHQPELVFLDVEMPDGLGFDLLKKTRDLRLDFYVIFITAHDKYAISAIRSGALDFLVKPIDPEELAFALENARRLQQKKINTEQLQLLLDNYERIQQQQLPSRIAISSQSDVSYILVENIIRLEAQQVYTSFHLNGESNPVVSSTNLGKYVEQFKLYQEFVQVHRSHMINLHYVKKYQKSSQTIILKDGSKVGLSRSFQEEFHKGMQNL